MMQKRFKNSLYFCGFALLLAACTTTNSSQNQRVRMNARNVNPDMAQACINASANKYYLPTSVIHAVDAKKIANGATEVMMQVDLRDAVCTITAKGRVQSIVDTSPKSADQAAADEAAKQKAALKAKSIE